MVTKSTNYLNSKELTYLLEHPYQVNDKHVNSLEKISREFPYFQSIRPLILKGLKNQESFRYNQELKVTAAYTTDRSVLFDFITSTIFQQDEVTVETKQKNKSDIDVVDPQEVKELQRIDIDDAVQMKIEEAEEVLDPSLFSTQTEKNILKQIETAENDKTDTSKDSHHAIEEKLQINKPLNFKKTEKHSFAEWLKLTSAQPLKEEPAAKKLTDKKDKFDLIDEFIANNPKIPPVSKSLHKRNLAKENKIQNEDFADQIRAIKKLQENK